MRLYTSSTLTDTAAMMVNDNQVTCLQPEAEAQDSRRRRNSRRLASAARALASAEAETAAADGEAATEGADDAAAEGEGTGGGTVGCTAADIDAATFVVPGALGPGTVPTDDVEPGEATAEGEAPNAEAAARKLQSSSSMPLVQAEAAAAARMGALHSRRALLDAAAEGETTAPAVEGEPPAGGDGGYKPIDFATPTTLEAAAADTGTVEGGPCAGFSTTPGSAHAMVNQDVVFGAAREIDGVQYFRIVDMFTPSRSKPQPDHMFCDGDVCGSDDITDAIGAPLSAIVGLL